jgi:hypothetical protein
VVVHRTAQSSFVFLNERSDLRQVKTVRVFGVVGWQRDCVLFGDFGAVACEGHLSELFPVALKGDKHGRSQIDVALIVLDAECDHVNRVPASAFNVLFVLNFFLYQEGSLESIFLLRLSKIDARNGCIVEVSLGVGCPCEVEFGFEGLQFVWKLLTFWEVRVVLIVMWGAE